MDKNITIAIDGYSSCGKSTLAKDLAKTLNYIFVDSGPMYRAVTLNALNCKLINDQGEFDESSIVNSLSQLNISFIREKDRTRTTLNGMDVEDEIRSKEVSSKVSLVAKIPEVRRKLVEEQRKLGLNGGIVMDGRDIGSVVFPNAELKLFVTADIDIRTERRFKELLSNGVDANKDEVRENLLERDRIDSTRKIAPLIRVHDAIIIDNSKLTRQDQLTLAVDLVNETLKKLIH